MGRVLPSTTLTVVLAVVTTILPLSAQDHLATTVLRSSGDDRPLPWSIEQSWTAGGLADTLLGTDAPFIPARIDVDATGRVYVLQSGQSRVVVLSGEDGSPVGTVGRSGRGPGEMADPVALAVSGDSLVVYDMVQGLVMWRTPTLSLLPSIPTGMIWMDDFGVTATGLVYSTTERLPNSDAGQYRQHVASWQDGEHTTLVSGPEFGMALYDVPQCGLGGMVEQRLFSPYIHWDNRGSRVVVGDASEYVLYVFDSEELTVRVERDIAPRRTDVEMARREATRRTWIGCEVAVAETVRLLGFEPYLPAVAGVAIAPSGNIWVLRGGLPDESRLIDVLTGDGRYLGTLPPDSPFPVAFLAADRILVAGRDNMEVPTLVSYRVVKN